MQELTHERWYLLLIFTTSLAGSQLHHQVLDIFSEGGEIYINPFFRFLSAKGIGCFRDTSRRAISTLEGRSRLLKGRYRSRPYAIQKCASAAMKRGYRMFAVQHGGWCASTKRAHLTYGRYGRSNRCRNGKGGPWANDVYVLKGKQTTILLP